MEGGFEEARELLHEAECRAKQNECLGYMLYAQWLQAAIDLQEGRLEDAMNRIDEVVHRPMFEQDLIEVLPLQASAHLAAGNVARAAQLSNDFVLRTREVGYVLALMDALLVQADVLTRQGQLDQAETVLREVIDTSRPMPYPYAVGRAMYQLGLVHAERGEQRPARECLEQALAIAQKLGARPLGERIQQALAPLSPGTNPRPQRDRATHNQGGEGAGRNVR
jgi:tetratricopeptide (TPR) repeat protein